MKYATVVSMIVLSDNPVADVNGLSHRNGYESLFAGVTYTELDEWDLDALRATLAHNED